MNINTNTQTLRLTSTERRKLIAAQQLLLAIGKHAPDSDCEAHAYAAADSLMAVQRCLAEPSPITE